MSSHQRTSPAFAVNVLRDGELSVVGRMPWSSNYTFLVEATLVDDTLVDENLEDENHCDTTERAVYKPEAGERTLDDFPKGIYKREVAAYELAGALGWPRIPTTIARTDAPFGVGSVQRFVPADFEQHYFTLLEQDELHEQLIEIAVFDLVANNADRKAGHCLHGLDGGVYAIDNGLCFHVQPKLRTVIWDFADNRLRENHLADLNRVSRDLPAAFADLLTDDEVEAFLKRVEAVNKNPVLPQPSSEWQFPWPLI